MPVFFLTMCCSAVRYATSSECVETLSTGSTLPQTSRLQEPWHRPRRSSCSRRSCSSGCPSCARRPKGRRPRAAGAPVIDVHTTRLELGNRRMSQWATWCCEAEVEEALKRTKLIKKELLVSRSLASMIRVYFSENFNGLNLPCNIEHSIT